MKKRPDYIVVGRFGRPRGLSGEIFLQPLTDNPKRLTKSGRFWIETEGQDTEIKLSAVNDASGKTAVRIKGVNGPEEAGKYSSQYLYIRSEDLGQPADGSFYYFDLIDCRAVDKSGAELGVVADVEHYPANDVLVIKDEKNNLFRLPMVAQFIVDIDLEKNQITINPPEGIFDSPDEN